MPMDRSRYPANWDELSLAVREKAEWKCEHCGQRCRRPGEDWGHFFLNVINLDLCGVDEVRHTQFVLTTAHLDQNPGNNDPANLKALCAPCHLRHDAPFRMRNHRAKLERNGQLNLLNSLEVKHGA